MGKETPARWTEAVRSRWWVYRGRWLTGGSIAGSEAGRKILTWTWERTWKFRAVCSDKRVAERLRSVSRRMVGCLTVDFGEI